MCRLKTIINNIRQVIYRWAILWGKGVSALLVVLALIIISQSAFAVYSWDINTSLGMATAWSNHKYLARSPDKATLYGVFTSGENIHFTRSTNEGVDWNAPIILSTLKVFYGDGGVTQSVDPSIVVDSSNVIHVVWWDDYYMNDGKNSEVFYRSCDAAAVDCININNWSAIIDISNSTGKEIFPLMVIDSANVKHLVWQENLSQEMYYSKCSSNCSNSANWSAGVNVSNTATDSYNPSIVVTSDRDVSIVWEEVTIPEEIYYTACSSATADCSNAGNWSAAVNVSSSTAESFSPRIVADSADKIHVVYSETDDDFSSSYTVYKSCAGNCNNAANWGNSAMVSNKVPEMWNEDASITVDSSNKLHVFWLESVAGAGNIRYRSRASDGSWGNIIELTSGTSIGYLGISCHYTNFNPAESKEKLDCVWTNKSNTKIVFFSITDDSISVSPADVLTLVPTDTEYLTIRPVSIPSGTYNISIKEFSIYSPYAFGGANALPWYYTISSNLVNYTFSVDLIISYLDLDSDGFEDITGVDETLLKVGYWQNGQWTLVPATARNTTANWVRVRTDHFSQFAMFGSFEPQIKVAPGQKRAGSKPEFTVKLKSSLDLGGFADGRDIGLSISHSSGVEGIDYAIKSVRYDVAEGTLDVSVALGGLENGLEVGFYTVSLDYIDYSYYDEELGQEVSAPIKFSTNEAVLTVYPAKGKK